MIPRFAADAGAAEIVAALTEHGCAIVERLVPDGVVDAVAAEMAPWLEATPVGGDDFSGRNTRRCGALLARSPSSVGMIAHPTVLEVAESFLWPRKTNFQLHLTQLIAIGPGSPAQSLHRDQWCFDFFPFPDDVEVELSTIWAMQDFTEANGATRVVPGSQYDPPSATRDVDRSVPAEMPKGSVVLYSGRTIHGGGANVSGEVRVGLNVDYVLGWLRQEENQYLSCPPEVAARLPEHVRRLAGYAMGAYALGYVDDVRDPAALFDGSAAGSSFGGSEGIVPGARR
jgi:ectoine hydroxylase-related dioxygenase (phytanoyl-CoA dioxygenase family)